MVSKSHFILSTIQGRDYDRKRGERGSTILEALRSWFWDRAETERNPKSEKENSSKLWRWFLYGDRILGLQRFSVGLRKGPLFRPFLNQAFLHIVWCLFSIFFGYQQAWAFGTWSDSDRVFWILDILDIEKLVPFG